MIGCLSSVGFLTCAAEPILKKRGQNIMDKYMRIDTNDVMVSGTPEYERIQRLRRQVVSAVPHLCFERAKIVTDFFKRNQNLSPFELYTGAFRETLSKMKIYILPDELIVGHQASMHRSAPVFPEFSVEWIKDEIDLFPVRKQDPFLVAEKDKQLFLNEIYPFWKGRTISDKILHMMPEDIFLQRFPAGAFSLGIHEQGGFGHVLPDFKQLVNCGLETIIEECKERKNVLKSWIVDDLKKAEFYDACITVCEAIIEFAKRYSKLANEMAEQETESKRRKELFEISEICSKVPARPAENLHEALQAAWFYQLTLQIYENAVAQSIGRVDQIFYPYYQKDILGKKLTKAQAEELLCAFFLKFAEPLKVYCAADCEIHAGFPMGQNACVGGLDIHGCDQTNDLSYRFLEANRHLKLGQPNFTARVHKNSPTEFLRAVAQTIRRGNGMPQLANDDVFIPSLMEIGVSLKEARDYGIIGCIEACTTNAWGRTNGGYFNIAKYVELALNDGKCMISNRQVGPKTGDASRFTSFEQVQEAFKVQLNYGMRLLVTWNNIIDVMHERLHPSPIVSMLVGGCIESGRDVTSGGAKYNWTAPLGVGVADTGNSLFAIQYAVFQEKRYTMTELTDALKNNFEGYAEMQAYLKNCVPKYGNNQKEVDGITSWAMDIFFDSMLPYTTPRGGPFVASLLPVASYVSFGKTTGALPYGRKAGEVLSDGISPTAGTDTEGPTSVFQSVCKIDHERCPNGVIFNQKFVPAVFEGRDGLDKFVSLMRAYIILGGGHVQFNIISSDILKEAQKDPDKYNGLVVRVAGYSALFNELSKEVQDTIIKRTQQGI